MPNVAHSYLQYMYTIGMDYQLEEGIPSPLLSVSDGMQGVLPVQAITSCDLVPSLVTLPLSTWRKKASTIL